VIGIGVLSVKAWWRHE